MLPLRCFEFSEENKDQLEIKMLLTPMKATLIFGVITRSLGVQRDEAGI